VGRVGLQNQVGRLSSRSASQAVTDERIDDQLCRFEVWDPAA